jgi:hypothetical protein
MFARPDRKKIFYLALAVVILLFGALSVWYINSRLLTEDEQPPSTPTSRESNKVSYMGKVSFIGKESYPNEKIHYVLSDTDGSDIILLKANDAKLSIVDGLHVKVYGKLSSTAKDGKELLLVEEVALENGSN